MIGGFISNAKVGHELKVVVSRKKSENSRSKKVKLKSKLFAVTPAQKKNLILIPNATDDQLKIRASWIGKH